MMINKKHSFHMVDMSPWPIMSSFGALSLVLGISVWFHTFNSQLFFMGLVLTMITSYQWWRDTSREGSFQGLHTHVVLNGLKMGMILFIISEVFFFLSFFWAFFHNSLAPTMEIGLNWPPIGVVPFNPFQIPLLNTIILLSSGITITWSHHSLMENKIKNSMLSLVLTLMLGAYFSLLQGVEYLEASFSISDSSFGASFFLATGFHGIHVLIGSSFIFITLMRMKNNVFSKSHHFGFEAAAWYWHFVDVVWLFLYINLYWWGG